MKLLKMEKDGKTADVHPDMVSEYEKGGYVLAKDEKPAPKTAFKPAKKGK